MKRKKLFILSITILLLTFSGVVYAAYSPDYDAGYTVGREYYAKYGTALNAENALTIHALNGYDGYIPKDATNGWRDYSEGFKAGYNDALNGVSPSVNYADSLGNAEGSRFGARDYYIGVSSNWLYRLPSDSEIVNKYNLTLMNAEYRIKFLDSFKAAFEKGYVDAYEKALIEPVRNSMSQGLANGNSVGSAMGKTFAEKDYIMKNNINFKRDIPTEEEIIKMFNLTKDTKEYRDAFIQGFLASYEVSYNQTYRSLAASEAQNRTVSKIIGISGDTISHNNGVTVTIPSGVFYKDVYVSIENQYTEYFNNQGMILVSDIFKIKLDNPSISLDNDQTIDIEFPYYGKSTNVGIYKLVNEKWYYLPTIISEGKIKASVMPSTITNKESIYAAFIDNGQRTLIDTRNHWAKDEINTMVRRNVILGYPDGTFRPEDKITRAEFLILLSRIENWTLPNYVANATYFKDYKTFENYDRIISYSLSMGYIKGYPDRTFRPNNNISYKEVELIIQRVTKNPSFGWTDVATNLMYDKTVRSKSFDDMNNKITRAEAAYMLYYLNEWRY
ncbi:MAG: S-layer homology domain-containing protein [Tissierellales bacterium]|nr:S-layer homology domain-containing protein [Tissierellales bacterium]